MVKRILLLIITLFFYSSVFAYPVVLTENHPSTYTVQPGDTLWDIACKFLQDPLQWPQLLSTNPQISSPYRLYPGQVLDLYIHNGRPELQVRGGGTIKLSPMARPVPAEPIEIVPLRYIKPFLNATRVVDKDQFLSWPYVVAHADEHLTTGKGDRIYVEGFTKPCSISEDYSIYRLGDPYIDPQTQELLGYQATSVGEAHLTRPGNPATFEITKSTMEVQTKDRLLCMKAAHVDTNFIPQVPSCPTGGQIISVLNGTTQIGLFNTVVIDRGRNNCLKDGDILLVYQLGKVIANPEPGKEPRNIKLPDERAGVVLIYNVFDKVSYGLIINARKPIHLLDYVRSAPATNV